MQSQQSAPAGDNTSATQDQSESQFMGQTTTSEQNTTQEQTEHEGEPIVVTLLPPDNNEG